MNSDFIWEKIFSARERWGYYPPEELVRFTAKKFYSAAERSQVKFLEMGCGPGGGPSWYIAREGFSFSGIDASPSAIVRAKERFAHEGLSGEFLLGDFQQLPWPAETFDCVIDVASLQHNAEKETQNILKEMYRVMKTGGWHFSMTVKDDCWGVGLGTRIDQTSYTDITEGPLADTGIIRFATKESLEILYSDYKNLQFEYSKRSLNHCRYEISNWIITCQK